MRSTPPIPDELVKQCNIATGAARLLYVAALANAKKE